MKRNSLGLFINDDEIRKLRPADADSVIAALDTNPDTQHKFTMPAGKRDRQKVEEWLAQHSANDQT
jgi:hypothetical protein